MWNSIQCAVRGRSHVKSEIPCQDKTYYMNNNDIEVVALADGAGSASLSHFGAEYATQKVCELLSQQFEIYYGEEDGIAVKRAIIGKMLEGLEKMSDDMKCEIKELASTLLAVAVHDGKYIILHIGDGVIGYVKDDKLKIASYPVNGEFVNTTVFLTSENVLYNMKLMKGKLNGITGFVLMSDGTETSFYNKQERSLVPVLKKIMDLLPIVDSQSLQNEIERSFETVVKQNTMDDCSLNILVEENCMFQGYRKLDINQKKKLFGISDDSNYMKQIRRYDTILEYIGIPKNISQISKRTNLRKKCCRRYIETMQNRKLIVAENGFFHRIIIMDK